MRGLLITELQTYARDVLPLPDRLRTHPHSDWNPVEAYPDRQFTELTQALAAAAGTSEATLLLGFGAWLFGRLARSYPVFVDRSTGLFRFLERLDQYVHADLQQLHPGTCPPSLRAFRKSRDQLVVDYHSSRPLADLAEGLLQGCITYFGESLHIERHDLTPDGRASRFTLTRGRIARTPG